MPANISSVSELPFILGVSQDELAETAKIMKKGVGDGLWLTILESLG